MPGTALDTENGKPGAYILLGKSKGNKVVKPNTRNLGAVQKVELNDMVERTGVVAISLWWSETFSLWS